jgi:hypothetical protein
MPEVVSLFTQNNDRTETKRIQKRIFDSYEADFSKHAPNEIVPRIRMVWQSVPSQLASEKYRPKSAIRASLANYKEETGMTNIPLYGIEYITDTNQK